MTDSRPDSIPLKTRLVFTVAMLAIPVLFFGMVEGTLRLVGFGSSYPLFVPVDGRPDVLYQNREVARRYFARIENVPSSLTDFFDAEKDGTTFRIFVQGGSSAAGFPFYYGGSFSRMLEQRLMQTFPHRHVEVVNTAMAAVNSYTLLDLADEIIAHEPDAVLIYAGHNEYYGALGVGSSESIGQFPWMIRTYLAVADLRVVQALRRTMVWSATRLSSAGEAPSGTLMQRMVGRQAIPYGSVHYELGLRQFRSNLSRLLAKYASRGIPVFIGTVASNERDHRPFVSGFTHGTDRDAWQARYRAGLEAAARGDVATALAAFDEAIGIDALHADAFYAKARVLEAAGRFGPAREAYVAAKDRDELRFRAPETINRIIAEEAARHGAVVVDARAALSSASPTGIVGSNVMTEHLHPNVDGYFLIADAFYEALREHEMIDRWTRFVPREEARAEVLLTPVDSLVGMFRVRQLMSTWPFQPLGVALPWIDSVATDDPVVRIALDRFLDRINWRDANEALRRHYESAGDHHRALQAALAHIQEYPFFAAPYLAAGNILVRQERFDEALTYFRAANAVDETALANRMIGSILLQRGDRGQALGYLERAVSMAPNDLPALYNLSGAYALQREFGRARETIMLLLEIEPGHEDARRLLASLPPVGSAGAPDGREPSTSLDD